jgi:hypothetical protein
MSIPQHIGTYPRHNDAAPGLYEPSPALPWLTEALAILDDSVVDPVFDGPLQPDGIHWGLGWIGVQNLAVNKWKRSKDNEL